MKPQEELYDILKDDITDDEIFGYLTRHTIDVYFDPAKVARMREILPQTGLTCA